jgi:hypothetical protein
MNMSPLAMILGSLVGFSLGLTGGGGWDGDAAGDRHLAVSYHAD